MQLKKKSKCNPINPYALLGSFPFPSTTDQLPFWECHVYGIKRYVTVWDEFFLHWHGMVVSFHVSDYIRVCSFVAQSCGGTRFLCHYWGSAQLWIELIQMATNLRICVNFNFHSWLIIQRWDCWSYVYIPFNAKEIARVSKDAVGFVFPYYSPVA